MTKRVLTWVNRQRETAGMAPLDSIPAGIMHAGHDCPLARALRDVYTDDDSEVLMVYPVGLEVTNGDWDTLRKISVPQYVGAAIKRFDQGKYPDLVLGAF